MFGVNNLRCHSESDLLDLVIGFPLLALGKESQDIQLLLLLPSPFLDHESRFGFDVLKLRSDLKSGVLINLRLLLLLDDPINTVLEGISRRQLGSLPS